jgi:hypothetical protein
MEKFGPSWPYGEPNGVDAPAQVEAFFADPSIALSAAELEAARTFGECMIVGRVCGTDGEPLVCGARRDLEEVYRAGDGGNTQAYYELYFYTPAGKDDLARVIAQRSNGSQTVTEVLHDIPAMGSLDATARQEMATRSLDWYKDTVAARLAEDRSGDSEQPDIAPLAIDYEPVRLLDKLDDLQAYRRFYGEVWRDLQAQAVSPLRDAKQTMLEIQWARVNNLIAELYPSALQLAWQFRRSNQSEQVQAYTARLAQTLPILRPILDRAMDETLLQAANDRFLRRIDLLRNGAVRESDGQFSPISPELLALQTELTSGSPAETPEAVVPEQLLEVLSATTWNAGQLQELACAVLAERGKLSAYAATWKEVSKRDGWAADGLWQVVVSPKVDSLSVNTRKRVVFVPASFKRSLTQSSPAGALAVEAHEQKHVDQAEYQQELGAVLPIARIRGRRAVTGLEAGGIHEERSMLALFGGVRPTDTRYLRMMQVKLRGGTQTEAARAFYDAYVAGRTLSADAYAKARRLAADRMLRLYRYGGHNSQPLDYAKQELERRAADHLDERAREVFMLISGSFALGDGVRLRRAGLWALPRDTVGSSAELVWGIFTSRYLPALLQEAGVAYEAKQ